MSSSNRVRITAIEETVYGQTPSVGDFDKARFTSESLSGTPETTESQTIRDDRMSQGQNVVGLTVSGDISMEMAKEDITDKFMASAMLNNWVTPATVNADLTIDDTAKTITRASGDFTSDTRKGDFIVLTGFTNTVNNTKVMVAEVVSATIIRYVGPEDTLVDEASTGNTFKVADYLEIGTTKKSFTMEKAFLDLADKAISYTGQLANTMATNFTYGEPATITFGFNGNGYKPVDTAAEFPTDGRTINPAATSNSLNGSVDMPFIANSAAGSLDSSTFCIQSVEANLNNNYRAQNCVGKVAPKDYTEGTAQIEVSLSAYLADENFGLLQKKLTQEPFELGYLTSNADGGYGFYYPAIQVSFDDPNASGQNADVIMSMSGTAKVGDNGESALRIYRF